MNCPFFNNFNIVKKSFLFNYKTWLFIIISVIVLSFSNKKNKNEINRNVFYNVFYGFLTFFIIFFNSYFVHLLCHLKVVYPINITHLYHHENTDWFSHFIQIVLEYFTFITFIFIQYYFNFSLNIWIILFFYFVYTTIHNVNYSILKVNDVHKLHHALNFSNMGPDICDLMFGTKVEYPKFENLTHYNLNIICSFLVVLFLKNIFNETYLIYIFLYLYYIIIFILFVSSVYLYKFCNIKNQGIGFFDLLKFNNHYSLKKPICNKQNKSIKFIQEKINKRTKKNKTI